MNKKLFKISAKEAFKNLRKSGPCFCEEISDKIEITGVFWHHLIFSKERNNKELEKTSTSYLLLSCFRETQKKQPVSLSNEHSGKSLQVI